VHQFALRASVPGAGEQVFAGLAAINIGPNRATLEALSIAGPSLFTVHATADHLQVTAPDPRMAAVLQRIPFWRDLSLLYRWSCPSTKCGVDGGTVENIGDVVRYRGSGGPASLRREEKVATLDDLRRGYSLTVVGDAP